ncbi:ABC transporter substrate-binding protein [Mesonia sp. HuA40]|uniref:ABC transporter substrate-binding protein n=1 Tax=Mesonia sp. HuA40 TaxID=2602761 RepID=UPI0011CAEAFD|nr:ABC transporter substrate-binding protein [Mesonia sp. HuA40]TXK74202.1 ABC transporter substrate-binding protein [Mesonia sp. HuA40]
MRQFFFCVLILTSLLSCKKQTSASATFTPPLQNKNETLKLKYASGFAVNKYENYTLLSVSQPWPDAQKDFIYAIAENKINIPDSVVYDAFVPRTLNRLIVTSTTHIPALESLKQLDKLIAFPNLNYISSPAVRTKIENGEVLEVGNKNQLNTELVLASQPDAVVASAINANNKSFSTLERNGIPVIYNGDWVEETPLGKAEWIKFFGVLLNQEQQADSIFNQIETNYLNAKKIAKKATSKPLVVSGSLYKDVWYAPAGDSWQAQLIQDANANYVYEKTKGKGSLSLALEEVLANAQNANIWISPGSFTSYKALLESNQHYSQLSAYQNKEVYTIALTTGETGGVLFYELGPNRPDLILMDLIKIFHPNLANYDFTFFKPLNP